MNSETSTRYGSRVRRHGRSRAVRAYQASSFLVNACALGGLAARGVDERVMPPQDTAHGRAMAAVGALDLVRYFGRWGRRPAQHVLGNAGRFTYLLIDMLRGLAERRVYIPRTFEQATNISYGSLCIVRSEEHTSELQSRLHLVCRLLLEKKKKNMNHITST